MEWLNFIECLNNVEDMIYRNENRNVGCIIENTLCTYGNEAIIDEEFCKNNNIYTQKIARGGGAIVHFKGDIVVEILRYNKDKQLDQDFISQFIDFIKSKGVDIKLVGNDLMIEDYKCGSFAKTNRYPDYTYNHTFFQISMNTDLELIKSICKKPMLKTPKGLNDYGITTEEVVEFVKGFFNKYENYI